MTNNEAVDLVKAKIAANPALEGEIVAAWNSVLDDLEARATKQRPKPKVFEVHHETVTARAALFQALAADLSINESAANARKSIGL